MAKERNKPQGTTLERIDKDYEVVISQRHKDFKDGYDKAKKEAMLMTSLALKAKEKELVDKACKWLEKNAENYVFNLTEEVSLPENPYAQKLVGFCVIDCIRDFKKAMEEWQ